MKATNDEMTQLFLEYEVSNMPIPWIPLPAWIEDIFARQVARKVSRKMKRFRDYLKEKETLSLRL